MGVRPYRRICCTNRRNDGRQQDRDASHAASLASDGYETQAVQPGPNPSVQVKFRARNNLVGIQARCVNGVPDITVG
jgi:hypothetical protein